MWEGGGVRCGRDVECGYVSEKGCGVLWRRRDGVSSSSAEVDMDVDEFEVGQVDKLNVMALEYGVPAGLFSK